MGKAFTLTERTMLTADGKAVPAGNPGGVMLLGVAGTAIPWAQAEACGLVSGSSADFPKHVGGGYYELSDGSKVKGKKDAKAAEKQLHEQSEDKALKPGEDK